MKKYITYANYREVYCIEERCIRNIDSKISCFIATSDKCLNCDVYQNKIGS